MGRKRAKQIADEIREELRSVGIDLGRGTELKLALLSEMKHHFDRRELWESSGSRQLPPTEAGDRSITIAEFARLAHNSAFALRRASDGLVASRSIAVDAIELSRRGAAALRATVGAHGLRDVPKRLHLHALAIALGLFELARSLVGYLATHHAPDAAAGRDAPDAWLDETGTVDERATAVANVALAHRVMERLRQRSDEEFDLRDRALMFAQRIAAAFQAASCEVQVGEIADHVRSHRWLEPSEVEAAKACIEAANRLGRGATDGEFAIALSMIDLLDGRPTDLANELRSAAEQLHGINRVGVLRTLIGLQDSPEAQADIADALIEATLPGADADAWSLRVQALPQLLDATAATALVDASRGAVLARRVAVLPDDHVFVHHHVWLIPGRTPVALIEWQPSELETVSLPALNDLGVMEALIVRHAEEFELAFDLGRLRQQLSTMIDPLRTALSVASGPVTFYAFGWMKHIPLASLTGRGSVLAVDPGVYLFAAGPSARTASQGGKRLYLIDEDLSDAYPLRIADGAEVARFDSREDGTEAVQVLQSAFAMPGISELVFFGHGHVDQFYVVQAGLVVGATDDGPIHVPSVVLSNLDLRSVEMALVMACGAGQGNVFVEPSLSVGHAFRRAGARCVIAPQWPILATDALAFTRRFLDLIEQGLAYDEAWARVLAEDPGRFMSIAFLTA